MKKTRTIALIAATLGLCQVANADVILGVSPSTDMGSGFGTFLGNTVNGVGLFGGVPSLNDLHEATTPSNSWVGDGRTTGMVTFDLGGLFIVDQISFWNQNGGGPGAEGTTGIRGIRIETSTDGATFVALVGGPGEFAQVPGIDVGPEIITFGAVAATHFRFNILGNWGDPGQTGFAEVHFNDVPAPSVLALLGLGVIATTRRRRR